MNALIKSLKKKYSGKRVLVVGLGLQGGGVGVARFFCELGAKVTVTDKKSKQQLVQSFKQLNRLPIEFRLGGHRLVDFLRADVIFKGPSVPWDLPEIIEAQKKNIPIEMELSFFAAYCPAKIIGVTGTRGKSTTSGMIFSLLKNFNYSVYLGGSVPNISTINYLKKISSDDWIVMELSSWALSGFHRRKISPHIAVFTNFYPDHLNYYRRMDDYFYDKQAIYLYQKEKDYLVANEKLKTMILNTKKKGNYLWFSKKDFPYKLKYLKGEHNLENASYALAVSQILGLDKKKAVETISNFKGLPYRQQIVGEKGKVIFINDTTSTTPTATIKALETFSDKPIYLILGGNSKNLPYDVLINQLIKTKKIILLAGSFTDEILPLLKKKYPEKLTAVYDDLEMAVKEAYKIAKTEGGLILFSPAATSFAMFNNEFERGAQFNKIVNNLIKQ